MKKLPYHEGSCIAIPLSNGGYAAGVVARVAPRGRIILLYIFAPKHETLPDLKNFDHLHASDALKVLMIGDLGLVNGEWSVIGDFPEWKKIDWPMPNFIRKDDISKRAWRVIYADNNPAKVEKEESVPYDFSGLERDSLLGYKSAEEVVSKLVS